MPNQKRNRPFILSFRLRRSLYKMVCHAELEAGLSWQIIAAVVVFLIPVVLLLRSCSSIARARSRGIYPPSGSGSDDDVITLMACGEEGLAIQLYGELHGGCLKNAKEAVETLANQDRPSGLSSP